MRKPLIIGVSILGGVVLLAVIAVLFVGMTSKPTAPVATTPTTPVDTTPSGPAPWNGQGTQELSLSATRGADVINYGEVKYSGLQNTAVNASVSITAAATASGKKPAWLTSSKFRMSSADLRVFKASGVSLVKGPTSYTLTLKYTNLPLDRLKASYEADRTKALGLTHYSSGGPYKLMLMLPQPPAEHAWGETRAGKPAKGKKPTAKELAQDRAGRRLAQGLE